MNELPISDSWSPPFREIFRLRDENAELRAENERLNADFGRAMGYDSPEAIRAAFGLPDPTPEEIEQITREVREHAQQLHRQAAIGAWVECLIVPDEDVRTVVGPHENYYTPGDVVLAALAAGGHR